MRAGGDVRDVRGDPRGDAGVDYRGDRDGRPPVGEAMQHLHPVLRPDRRRPRLRRCCVPRHGRRLLRLRLPPLPSLTLLLRPGLPLRTRAAGTPSFYLLVLIMWRRLLWAQNSCAGVSSLVGFVEL